MDTLTTLLIEAAVLVLVFVILFSGFRWIRWVSKNAKNEFIREQANDAYAWAESHGRELIGSEKAKVAYKYLAEQVNKRNISLTPEQIEAAVQLAWNRWEGTAKASAPKITVAVPQDPQTGTKE